MHRGAGDGRVESCAFEHFDESPDERPCCWDGRGPGEEKVGYVGVGEKVASGRQGGSPHGFLPRKVGSRQLELLYEAVGYCVEKLVSVPDVVIEGGRLDV